MKIKKKKKKIIKKIVTKIDIINLFILQLYHQLQIVIEISEGIKIDL